MWLFSSGNNGTPPGTLVQEAGPGAPKQAAPPAASSAPATGSGDGGSGSTQDSGWCELFSFGLW